MAKRPILENIVRQHAEMAAFLWNVYDENLLNPDKNPDMDEERIMRLVERLEAHLDGLRVAGSEGRRIAEERYRDFPEVGELFVMRMLTPEAQELRVSNLVLDKVRAYLKDSLPPP